MYLSALILISVFCSSNTYHIPPRPQRQRPNIIYILADDVGYNDVGWHNTEMRTPILDNLAKNGVILDNFYATPLCTPSRAALLTGKLPCHLGLQRGVLNPQEPYGVPLSFKMIPQKLKEVGYSTHAIGKWHVGYCNEFYTPVKRGFDTFFGFYNGAENNYYHCLNNEGYYVLDRCAGRDLRYNNIDVSKEYNGTYSEYLFSNRAVEIIEKKPRNRPLFMYVAFTDGHFPLQAPTRFRKICSHIKNPARVKMCAAMAATDEGVGRILEALKTTNQLDNTLIIFTSDNGGEVVFGGNNLPYRGQKNTLMEGGNKVPAFVYGPKILGSVPYTNRQLIHITDWFPTIMRIAGIAEDVKLNLDGVDQWETIRKNELTRRRLILYNLDDVNGTLIGAIRYKNYKYYSGPRGNMDRIVPESEVVDYSFNETALFSFINNSIAYDLTDKTEKLYNLRDDPTETYDIASEKPDVLIEMRERLNAIRSTMLPAVKRADKEEGDPSNFGGVYSTGWCAEEKFVPSAWSRYNDLTIYSRD